MRVGRAAGVCLQGGLGNQLLTDGGVSGQYRVTVKEPLRQGVPWVPGFSGESAIDKRCRSEVRFLPRPLPEGGPLPSSSPSMICAHEQPAVAASVYSRLGPLRFGFLVSNKSTPGNWVVC